jgi:hypothetical protein
MERTVLVLNCRVDCHRVASDGFFRKFIDLLVVFVVVFRKDYGDGRVMH